MTSGEEFFRTDAIFDAVASFDIATLHLAFDATHFSFDPPRVVRDGRLDDITAWGDALHNIPSPTLAHELAHIMQIATTPTGVRDYFHHFVAEGLALETVGQLGHKLRATLPVGLLAYKGNLSDTVKSSASRYLEFSSETAARIGGIEFRADDPAEVNLLAERYPGFPYHQTSGPNGSSIVKILGNRHLYEAFGGLTQMMRANNDDLPLPHLPHDPYGICTSLFLASRPSPSRLAGSFQELAVVLDTALLEDPWLVGRSSTRLPFNVFLDLLEVLEGHPELQLRSIEPGDVADFQNQLMELAQFAVPDVREIVESVRTKIPVLFEEIKATSRIPRYILDDYERSIRLYQEFRIEEFGGACPLQVLTASDRAWLETLASLSVTGQNGLELPFTVGNSSEYPSAFLYQQARIWRQVLAEILVGPRRCPLLDNCVLPSRPSCAGITGDLSSPQDQCARESLTAQILADSML